jgi:hypothetical protein
MIREPCRFSPSGAGEEDKVARAAEALAQSGIRQREFFRAEQRFNDYPELLAEIGDHGRVALERAQQFADATNISISMDYGLTLP